MKHLRLFESFLSEESDSDSDRKNDNDKVLKRVTPKQEDLDFKKYFIDKYSMIIADLKPSN